MARGRPELSIREILKWADAFHAKYGFWPREGGQFQNIDGTLDEKWKNIDDALRRGLRSLPGGSSLARLLLEKRGVRNAWAMPRYTVKQILVWCDAYFKTHGR